MYGQTIVTTGVFDVSVKGMGGNDACSVESIAFTAVNQKTAESTSTPAYNVSILQRASYVAVPLVAWSEYEVYAVGICSSGEIFGLPVFSTNPTYNIYT
jgi:hypothetical protein